MSKHNLFVGCGNMGQAMVAGWLLAGEPNSSFTAVRPSGRPVPGIRTVQRLGELDRAPDRLILGFKPQQLQALAPEVARWVTPQTVVVSMLAGADVATLTRLLPGARAIVRVMPNLPVAVRRGVLPLYTPAHEDKALQAELQPWFSMLGFAPWCASEEEFGAIGFVSGSTPAYVARFIEAFAKAGEGRGLEPGLALTAAREAVLGSAWLAASSGEPMAELARKVTSPNGTTEAGLRVLDAELPGLVDRTLAAATRRSAELAAETRGS
ncbi:pyrroline-5-carboxylate reductase family protein [Sphingomonas astaxanthinifaciens]|uniref:Pyrroline-5-carboxylate reductase n=1 Tax=Sphingomonas astaxanthinifaciens DSM 22298 TaxID=1123267 RepID=A0ABQ5Z6P0_9SPHN|nr:pyrroline-5-carboxylate reductase [Sphingomonas astaxanthinifaciens]GLR47071.1 pyrroline-5-carboxylate reductase [Sphingomonas astaxanthinifaciens DSM 22298]